MCRLARSTGGKYMKNIKCIIAVFTFVAAAIGLIVAAVYFIDRKCGLFCNEDEDESEYCGEEYFSDDIALEDSEESVAEEVEEADEQ